MHVERKKVKMQKNAILHHTVAAPEQPINLTGAL